MKHGQQVVDKVVKSGYKEAVRDWDANGYYWAVRSPDKAADVLVKKGEITDSNFSFILMALQAMGYTLLGSVIAFVGSGLLYGWEVPLGFIRSLVSG